MRFINNKHFYFIWVFTSLFLLFFTHTLLQYLSVAVVLVPPTAPISPWTPFSSLYQSLYQPSPALCIFISSLLFASFVFLSPLSLLHPDSTPPSIHQAPYRSLKNHCAANLDPPLQGLIFDSISIIERRSLPFRLMVDWQFSIFQVVFKDSPMKWLETCTHRHPGFQEAKCHYLEFSDGKLTHKLWKMHVRGNNRDKKKMCKWQSRRLKHKMAEMTNTVFAKVDTQLALKVNQSALPWY